VCQRRYRNRLGPKPASCEGCEARGLANKEWNEHRADEIAAGGVARRPESLGNFTQASTNAAGGVEGGDTHLCTACLVAAALAEEPPLPPSIIKKGSKVGIDSHPRTLIHRMYGIGR
jgi:hypothetical protein